MGVIGTGRKVGFLARWIDSLCRKFRFPHRGRITGSYGATQTRVKAVGDSTQTHLSISSLPGTGATERGAPTVCCLGKGMGHISTHITSAILIGYGNLILGEIIFWQY